MPLVVNENLLPGLGVANGAEFKATDVIPDERYPGYAIAADITIHFRPPKALLIEFPTNNPDTPAIPGLLPNSLLQTRKTVKVTILKNLLFSQSGILFVPTFVVMDYKAQGKNFDKVLLHL